jgi:two-component sensor histidine kinase
VRAALAEASERLKALASVYDSLSLSSEGLGTIRLQDQLQQICDRIRQGLVRPGIALETDLEPMLVPRETGACIGIVVNELVTNACKHAFPGREGTIRVTVRNGDGHARIEVADDGCGMPARRPSRGLGARLVEAFVRRIDGRAETFSSPEGTIHSIMVPL